MKIALTGTMSCGKTTLIKHLAELPEFEGYFIATERSKYLRDLGVELNEDSTIKGQFLFAAERASELMHDKLLSDRSIYDVISFTALSKTISFPIKEDIIKAFSTLTQEYDLIIYVSPEGMGIEDNGVRTTDPLYRAQIDQAIQWAIEEWCPKDILTVTGSVEDRTKTILDYLSNIYSKQQ